MKSCETHCMMGVVRQETRYAYHTHIYILLLLNTFLYQYAGWALSDINSSVAINIYRSYIIKCLQTTRSD
jgi:hypothetical protein